MYATSLRYVIKNFTKKKKESNASARKHKA